MNTEDIIFSLQRYWKNSGPSEVLTVFPGTQVDVSTQTSWIEFWLNQIHDLPKRSSSPQRFSFLIDIHFFSRDVNKRSVSALVDVAREVLQETSIEVFAADSQSTQVGQLRFREPTIRDFTRNESLSHRNTLQHLVLSIQATAIQH
ncbi:hypothetical protein OAF98_02095 [Planctomicrobium sp.]|jgi:hypothetical protein|nr:hypothetical protein [Planctomicrobium sp.]MDA7527455.1 hypothetical protein [bacterium]MBT5020602.1 hypothetical protein [Planctomicrobium sp.]MDB4439819.1 hypothetical protein [Planctomicrobium sp.]MDB4731296.1 hypothetical protein [bacterium]MDB4733380.1 hypothetical protein [Planctomicrobium sp.]